MLSAFTSLTSLSCATTVRGGGDYKSITSVFLNSEISDVLLLFPQVPLIVKVKNIKIGFLGYCDVFSIEDPKTFHYTCVVRQGKLNAGPALYSDEVATRDVNALKVVI